MILHAPSSGPNEPQGIIFGVAAISANLDLSVGACTEGQVHGMFYTDVRDAMLQKWIKSIVDDVEIEPQIETDVWDN